MEHKYKKIYEFKQIIKAYLKYAKMWKHGYYSSKSVEEWNKNSEILWKEYNKLLAKHGITIATGWNEKHLVPGQNKIRLLYVAYGLSKGKSYIQIERPREENQLTEYDWSAIKKIMDKFKEEVMETENV